MAKTQSAKKSQGNRAARRSLAPFVIIGAVLLAALVAGAWYLRSSPRAPGTVATGERGADPPHAAGEASAPVTLEEFGDYQCPPCGLAFPEIEKIEQEYAGRVRFIFRQYPLVRVHQNAMLAAHAAEAAGLQGKFWEMHRELYTNQKEWSNTKDPLPGFETDARRAGVDVERFRRDMGGAQVDARVVADHARAQSVGVESTPTFFVNGRKLNIGANLGRELRAEINRALSGS